MKKSMLLAVAVCMVVVFGNAHFASASIDEAKAMVEKAAAFYNDNGKVKALQAFNDPNGEFVKGSIYIFAYDAKGTIIAHPINAKLVGMNTLNVPDVDGKLWRQEAVNKANSDGWAIVDYKFKNPATNKVEEKTSYFKKVGDIILGCGTYK
jgi:signal transduction histidine kinase